jgi:hypothetical protein
LEDAGVEGVGGGEEVGVGGEDASGGVVVVGNLLEGGEVGPVEGVEGFSDEAEFDAVAIEVDVLGDAEVEGGEAGGLNGVAAEAGGAVGEAVAVVVEIDVGAGAEPAAGLGREDSGELPSALERPLA